MNVVCHLAWLLISLFELDVGCVNVFGVGLSIIIMFFKKKRFQEVDRRLPPAHKQSEEDNAMGLNWINKQKAKRDKQNRTTSRSLEAQCRKPSMKTANPHAQILTPSAPAIPSSQTDKVSELRSARRSSTLTGVDVTPASVPASQDPTPRSTNDITTRATESTPWPETSGQSDMWRILAKLARQP